MILLDWRGGDINNDMTITILHNNIGTILLNTIINYSNVNSYRAKINDDQIKGWVAFRFMIEALSSVLIMVNLRKP